MNERIGTPKRGKTKWAKNREDSTQIPQWGSATSTKSITHWANVVLYASSVITAFILVFGYFLLIYSVQLFYYSLLLFLGMFASMGIILFLAMPYNKELNKLDNKLALKASQMLLTFNLALMVISGTATWFLLSQPIKNYYATTVMIAAFSALFSSTIFNEWAGNRKFRALSSHLANVGRIAFIIALELFIIQSMSIDAILPIILVLAIVLWSGFKEVFVWREVYNRAEQEGEGSSGGAEGVGREVNDR